MHIACIARSTYEAHVPSSLPLRVHAATTDRHAHAYTAQAMHACVRDARAHSCGIARIGGNGEEEARSVRVRLSSSSPRSLWAPSPSQRRISRPQTGLPRPADCGNSARATRCVYSQNKQESGRPTYVTRNNLIITTGLKGMCTKRLHLLKKYIYPRFDRKLPGTCAGSGFCFLAFWARTFCLQQSVAASGHI